MTHRRFLCTALALSATATACVTAAEDDPLDSEVIELGQDWKILDVDYQVQQTGYWCGPAASRIALSTRIAPPSQQALANQLGTTTNGTDWIGQVTRTLNDNLPGTPYVTVEMPNDPPTAAQRDRLWHDIVRSIDARYAVVANIVAPPSNHPPGYPDETIYHYFAVIGYNPVTWEVFIADSASFSGQQRYWLPFAQLATLIPPKGYATLGNACDAALTIGLIDEKYRALGGCGSLLGAPLTSEQRTPDGTGRYNVFERGSIYWTPATGAHEVHGRIRDKWAELGWEGGTLGYPTTDEVPTPDGAGRYTVFERGSVYWSPATDAHEVHGRIRETWAERGWESGALGYPTSDEYAVSGGRRNDFQRGSITWTAATNQTSVTLAP